MIRPLSVYEVAILSGTPTLRPRRTILAHCAAPIDLRECTRWWVGETLPGDPSSRGVSVEWRTGRREIKGFLTRLALPNRAPDVELVIGQLQYRQPSVTSPPYIKQRDRLGENQRGPHTRPAHQSPARMPVTIRKAHLNLLRFVACHSLKKIGEPSVSAQEINPVGNIRMSGPGFECRSYQASTVTTVLQGRTLYPSLTGKKSFNKSLHPDPTPDDFRNLSVFSLSKHTFPVKFSSISASAVYKRQTALSTPGKT